MKYSQRLQRLGPLSLASLLIGSVILLLVSFNCLAGDLVEPMLLDSQAYPFFHSHGRLRRFKLGNSLLLQTWLAILGIAVSSLIYGFNQTWIHYFDMRCASQARSD